MSGDYEDDLCRRALILVSDLCARVRDSDTNDRCQEFNELRIRGYPRGPDAGQHPAVLASPCLHHSQGSGNSAQVAQLPGPSGNSPSYNLEPILPLLPHSPNLSPKEEGLCG